VQATVDVIVNPGVVLVRVHHLMPTALVAASTVVHGITSVFGMDPVVDFLAMNLPMTLVVALEPIVLPACAVVMVVVTWTSVVVMVVVSIVIVIDHVIVGGTKGHGDLLDLMDLPITLVVALEPIVLLICVVVMVVVTSDVVMVVVTSEAVMVVVTLITCDEEALGTIGAGTGTVWVVVAITLVVVTAMIMDLISGVDPQTVVHVATAVAMAVMPVNGKNMFHPVAAAAKQNPWLMMMVSKQSPTVVVNELSVMVMVHVE
jgi:hypothetical protein